MELLKIVPESFKMDGGSCFGVVPKSIWSKIIPSEDNLINLTSRCLLVKTQNRRILIDTGMGNKQSDKYFGYYYLFNRIGIEKALIEAGISTDSITDVVLTHLHFDHVGGAVKWSDQNSLCATFPNATYYCSKAQWDHAINPNPREKASFFDENYRILFDEGRLEFIYEEMNFCPGIDLEIKNGHTIGQIIPMIEYKNRKLIFTADFISLAGNIPVPYVPSYDIAPVKAMEEKQEFLNRAADHGYILFFEHDYYTECCTVEQTSKGVRVAETFLFDEIR